MNTALLTFPTELNYVVFKKKIGLGKPLRN